MLYSEIYCVCLLNPGEILSGWGRRNFRSNCLSMASQFKLFSFCQILQSGGGEKGCCTLRRVFTDRPKKRCVCSGSSFKQARYEIVICVLYYNVIEQDCYKNHLKKVLGLFFSDNFHIFQLFLQFFLKIAIKSKCF